MSPIRLELDPSIRNHYTRVAFLLQTATTEADWKESLLFVTGNSSTAPPLPLLTPGVTFTAEEIVGAHLSVFTGFLSYFLTLTPKDIPIEVVFKMINLHTHVAVSGGWGVYWPSARNIRAVKLAISHLDVIDPSITWNEHVIDTPVGKMKLAEWLNEFLSVYQMASRVGQQARSMLASMEERNEKRSRALIFHSDGFARLEKEGEVYPLMMLTEEEVSLIEYFGPLVARMSLNELPGLQAILAALKGLNPLAVQALTHNHNDYFIDPYHVIHGIKIVHTAIPMGGPKGLRMPISRLSAVDTTKEIDEFVTLFKSLPKMPGPTKH